MPTRLFAAALLFAGTLGGQPAADHKEWIQLFNGRDLTGWQPKIAGHDLNDNFGNTFRVVNGNLQVSYDAYDTFNSRFGHIFYKDKFSYYIIAVEYRFIGEQSRNAPAWALRNNGIMVHCQAPETMGKNQDFPISIEVQLLGGTGAGPRPTANMCSPGTEVDLNGKKVPGHCTESSSKTFDGDQWVRVEAIVKGDESIEHFVNGESVLKYEHPRIGGGQVNNFDPKVKVDGTPLKEGYISLQSESHPTEFRKIELLNLAGCMDPKAKNFKSYYVHAVPAECKY
jgi:hypothetical protein